MKSSCAWKSCMSFSGSLIVLARKPKALALLSTQRPIAPRSPFIFRLESVLCSKRKRHQSRSHSVYSSDIKFVVLTVLLFTIVRSIKWKHSKYHWQWSLRYWSSSSCCHAGFTEKRSISLRGTLSPTITHELHNAIIESRFSHYRLSLSIQLH